MLSRRNLIFVSATGLAAPALLPAVPAYATPRNIVVMAKSIDDIVGGLDPADAYEITNAEVCGNIYRRIVLPDPADPNTILGDTAESWEAAPDGRMLTFRIRSGMKFESGNPVTAEDAAFSLRRVVKLGKAPSFIIKQFGYTSDNVEDMIVAEGPDILRMRLPSAQAPTFVLYCLSANCASVVEKAQVMAHQVNGDLGNAWLRTHSAGSGSYRLIEWQASDRIALEANPHAPEPPRIPRVVIRHVAEPSTQYLLLEKGDADIARDLTSDQLKSIGENPAYAFARTDVLNEMYLALNMAKPEFQKSEVLQAVKLAIDYEGIARNITPSVWNVWQTFLPKGSPASLPDQPFRRDVPKARALLKQAGLGDGFTVTLDHFAKSPYVEIAQAVQADLGAIGIKVELLSGEQRQVYGRMRARQHQMLISTWVPDYMDPNSTAQAFLSDDDDSDGATVRLLAWRCHYVGKERTAKVVAATTELDAGKRNEMYLDMQRDALEHAPFVIMLQQAEIATMRKGTSGLTIGALPDFTRYHGITKA